MKFLCLILVLFFAGFAQTPQIPQPKTPSEQEDTKLPNGKSQREEILKADHKKNIEEAAELLRLAEEVKADLEMNDRYVVSVKTLKKTGDIEKLARSIRGRLTRY
jgi:hypothetical protein